MLSCSNAYIEIKSHYFLRFIFLTTCAHTWMTIYIYARRLIHSRSWMLGRSHAFRIVVVCVSIVDHVLAFVLTLTIICSHVYLVWWSHASMCICFDVHLLLCPHALMVTQFYVHMFWWSYAPISTCFDENMYTYQYSLMLICSNTFLIACSYVCMLC